MVLRKSWINIWRKFDEYGMFKLLLTVNRSASNQPGSNDCPIDLVSGVAHLWNDPVVG